MSEEISGLPLQPQPPQDAPSPPAPTAAFSEQLPLASSAPEPSSLGAELLRFVLSPLQPPRPPNPAEAALGWLESTFRALGAQEDALDDQIARALSGEVMSTQELLVLQAQVYRFTFQTELLSKVIEKGTGTIKQLMNTQV